MFLYVLFSLWPGTEDMVIIKIPGLEGLDMVTVHLWIIQTKGDVVLTN